MNVPIVVWLLRCFILGISEKIEECANKWLLSIGSIFRDCLTFAFAKVYSVCNSRHRVFWNEFLYAIIIVYFPNLSGDQGESVRISSSLGSHESLVGPDSAEYSTR